MARMNDIKVGFDLSAINNMVQVCCMACGCKHNTINRSHGTSIARCDYKHIQVSESGQCQGYDPKEDKA